MQPSRRQRARVETAGSKLPFESPSSYVAPSTPPAPSGVRIADASARRVLKVTLQSTTSPSSSASVAACAGSVSSKRGISPARSRSRRTARSTSPAGVTWYVKETRNSFSRPARVRSPAARRTGRIADAAREELASPPRGPSRAPASARLAPCARARARPRCAAKHRYRALSNVHIGDLRRPKDPRRVDFFDGKQAFGEQP